MISTYLFEAKSIQSYIFATNRLKEIVGGSELIESITGVSGLLDHTLNALQFREEICFSRRGGGAFYAFGNAQAIGALADVWPLLIRKYAPNMEFIHARAHGKDAKETFEIAHQQLLADRNRPKPRWPLASVFAHRFQRTGEPANGLLHHAGGTEIADEATLGKLKFAKSGALGQRFDTNSTRDKWPLNLTPEANDDDGKNFPFIGESRIVGLVHADGNGLGQLLMDLKTATVTLSAEQFISIFQDFSEAITRATETAAQQATQEILAPAQIDGVYPARPIVLGGDDLTMIVRADLALPFTEAFLKAFAAKSELELSPLKAKYNLTKLPQRLTACAGLVYAKSSQPFYLLHELAEDLCKHAKKKAKAYKVSDKDETPSALSFHRVTTALTEDYQTIVEQELSVSNLHLTRECYAIEHNKGLPVLTDLLKFQTWLQQPGTSQNGIRQLLGLLFQAPEQAASRYNRWREITGAGNLDQFDVLLEKLVEPKSKDIGINLFNPNTSYPIYTPFSDVLILNAIDNKLPTAEEMAA